MQGVVEPWGRRHLGPGGARVGNVLFGFIDDVTDLTSTDSSKSLSLNWLSYRLLQPYSIKVTVGVTEQW